MPPRDQTVRRPRLTGLLLFWALPSLTVTLALAAEPLPYTERTRGYAGWSSTVRGDIRTIGMAGAMVGLADTFLASADNPAGLAMSMGGLALQFSGNKVNDGDIQTYANTLSSSNGGAAANLYPWGLSVGYWFPYTEGQYYQLLPSGQDVYAGVQTREIRVSAARVFFDHRLSIGTSLIFGQADRSLDFRGTPELSNAHHSYNISAAAGIMWQLPKRFLLGASYSMPVTYQANALETPSSGLPGFFQPVYTPYRLGVGLGWIPNRLFRAGFTLYWIGATPGAALIADQSRTVGANPTLQPRLGVTYTAVEFKELQIHLSAGTYLEVSRIEGTPSRMHGTFGIEVSPWIFNFGWALDEGPPAASNRRSTRPEPTASEAPYRGFRSRKPLDFRAI